MASARLLGILGITLCVAQSNAQTIPTSKPTDRTAVAAIPQAVQDEFYAAKRAATRKNMPRIIFVPGILGSKIDECRSDNSQCTNIWGTVEAITRSNVDLTRRSDRTYRTDVVDALLFKDFYGGTLDHIRKEAERAVRDGSDDAFVTVLHYDWRLSNGENAKILKDRVCQVRANAEASPIVIVAHSMGGIIAKVWTARHAKEPCRNGEEPKVTQIIFVATPHLGSPKAVKAIAEGYNNFFDELTGFKRYLGIFESNYLLEAVNQAGISFASLYELLPIRTSEYCVQQKPALAAVDVPVVGDDDKPVNLFDAETWRRYDLLRRVGVPDVRRSYYENNLAPRLREAELLLCEIVDFNPATVTDVVYLYGREKTDRTYGSFHLRSGASSSIREATTGKGDGTVPVYSAQNFLVSTTRQTEEVEADHTTIVNSAKLLGLIDKLYLTAVRRADLETVRTNTQFASLLTADRAASGSLLPVSSDPNAWSKDDDKWAIEINRNALTLMGYTPAVVAGIAATTADASERAQLYAVAASSTTDKSQQLAWIGDVARSSYAAGNFEDAIVNALFVAATAQGSPANDPKKVSLQKAAEETAGWAYLRRGDVGKFNELASSYAAKYAVSKNEFKEPSSPQVTNVIVQTSPPSYANPPTYVYQSDGSQYPLYGSQYPLYGSNQNLYGYRTPYYGYNQSPYGLQNPSFDQQDLYYWGSRR